MAFVPNGTIKLLAGVPLDNSYTHTVKYASASAQTSAFLAKAKRTYEHCTYIRETARLRIPDVYDDVVMCNYLMYQNQGYGNNKWFYAFITGVYYVNDHATEIEFELDVMQTWAFDYEILPGFVERNHTATDVIGEHILPEPVNTGELIIQSEVDSFSVFSEWDVIAYTTFDWNTWTIPANLGTLAGNVFSGLVRSRLGMITLSRSNNGVVAGISATHDPRQPLSNLVNNHPDLVDGLVALVMSPHALEVNERLTLTLNKPTSSFNMAGVVPRNKKLYTGQFLKLFVNDGAGGGRYYNFEDFVTNDATFHIYTDRAPDQSLICVPVGYGRGAAGASIETQNESIVMGGFPQCAWVSDVFKTYMAQNQANINLTCATAAMHTVVGTATAIATGGLVGGGELVGGLQSIVGVMANMEDKQKQPPKQHGAISNTVMMAVGQKRFTPIVYVPKAEFVTAIDGFFDMYGYQVNTVGVPNTDVRPYWCYAKMQGAAIKPKGIDGLPASDMRTIENNLNRGITFWKDLANVGNYALNNTV